MHRTLLHIVRRQGTDRPQSRCQPKHGGAAIARERSAGERGAHLRRHGRRTGARGSCAACMLREKPRRALCAAEWVSRCRWIRATEEGARRPRLAGRSASQFNAHVSFISIYHSSFECLNAGRAQARQGKHPPASARPRCTCDDICRSSGAARRDCLSTTCRRSTMRPVQKPGSERLVFSQNLRMEIPTQFIVGWNRSVVSEWRGRGPWRYCA